MTWNGSDAIGVMIDIARARNGSGAGGVIIVVVDAPMAQRPEAP
jgi:hypothetical protein